MSTRLGSLCYIATSYQLSISHMVVYTWGFPGGASGREPACQCKDIRDLGLIPASGYTLEEGMATHSSILDWRIPWTEEPDGLLSTGLERVRHD